MPFVDSCKLNIQSALYIQIHRYLSSAQAIINFSKETAADKEDGTNPPNIGRGVGMALGLFLLTGELENMAQTYVHATLTSVQLVQVSANISSSGGRCRLECWPAAL